MTRILPLAIGVAALLGGAAVAADPPAVEFREEPGRVLVRVNGAPFATYVYRDEAVPRPYFAHVRVPGGPQVTRTHPPVAGTDPVDHPAFHPGIWLAFGDLGGADHWRNKAAVRHAGFAETPTVKDGVGRFAVRNEYLTADGKSVVCTEVCRYTVTPKPDGVALGWDSEFRSDAVDFAFGDQEEMGLGVRVATVLTVKNGGRITNAAGDTNEKAVRGKAAEWCEFGGVVDGRRVGVRITPDPANFRPSWFHARDYGLVVANPFARKSLAKGEPSRVVVRKGETFRLRFEVRVFSVPVK